MYLLPFLPLPLDLTLLFLHVAGKHPFSYYHYYYCGVFLSINNVMIVIYKIVFPVIHHRQHDVVFLTEACKLDIGGFCLANSL